MKVVKASFSDAAELRLERGATTPGSLSAIIPDTAVDIAWTEGPRKVRQDSEALLMDVRFHAAHPQSLNRIFQQSCRTSGSSLAHECILRRGGGLIYTNKETKSALLLKCLIFLFFK